MVLEDNDWRERRCPLLGNTVTFSYCRTGAKALPCARTFDCWWEAFDIRAFMESHYSAEEIEIILTPPEAKTLTIYEMIQKAQKHK